MKPDECPACHAADCQTLDQVSWTDLVAGFAAPPLLVDVPPHLAPSGTHIRLQHCRACDLRWYADAPAGDGPFYVALQAHDWYYQDDKAEYGFARQHVVPGAKVLEVGCGRGAFRSRLPDDISYRGLEFNEGAVKQAKALGLDVDIRALEDEADAHPGQYDVVCHFQVLEHVSDPGGFMADCARALRPGGTLIVAVPAEDSFIGLAESSWMNMPPHHLSRWSDKALLSAFERVGVSPKATWHEEVSPLHSEWHRSTMAHLGWLALQGSGPRLVASPKQRRLSRWVGKLPGMADALFRRGMKAHPQARHGHSVCIVGHKR